MSRRAPIRERAILARNAHRWLISMRHKGPTRLRNAKPKAKNTAKTAVPAFPVLNATVKAATTRMRGIMRDQCRGGGLTRLATPSGEIATLRRLAPEDRKSTRLNSSHVAISYAVFCL